MKDVVLSRRTRIACLQRLRTFAAKKTPTHSNGSLVLSGRTCGGSFFSREAYQMDVFLVSGEHAVGTLRLDLNPS